MGSAPTGPDSHLSGTAVEAGVHPKGGWPDETIGHGRPLEDKIVQQAENIESIEKALPASATTLLGSSDIQVRALEEGRERERLEGPRSSFSEYPHPIFRFG